MIDSENFIGAIPKDIFNKPGKHYVDGKNDRYNCILRENEVMIMPLNLSCRVIGSISDNYFVTFDVCNKHRNLDLHVSRLILEGIVPYFISQGFLICGIQCEWPYWSVNNDLYHKVVIQGGSKEKAVQSTWTYNKIAVPLGFNEIYSIEEEVSKINVVLI